MENYKEYLQNEILNLEEELTDLAIRLEEMKLKQRYKTGRSEAYKASLEHLLAEEKK
jgi:hypothetical protein